MYYIGSMAYDPNYLEHHGILGMKWGVRRYQNPDGSLTQAGKHRYFKTEDGKYKKRTPSDRGVAEGLDMLTKKNGRERSAGAAILRATGASTVRALVRNGILGAAMVGGSIAFPGAANLIKIGGAAAAVGLNIRESARLRGTITGIDTAEFLRNEMKEMKGARK